MRRSRRAARGVLAAALAAAFLAAAPAHAAKTARRGRDAASYFRLGWTRYERGFAGGVVETADQNDAQAAADAYRTALKKDPGLRGIPDPYRLYFSLALCEEALQSYDRALAAYRTALRLAPDKALIPLHAARLRLKMEDPDKTAANIALALDKARRTGQEKALREAARNDPVFAPLRADASARRALGLDAPRDETFAAGAQAETLRDAVRDAPKPAPPAQEPAVLQAIARGDLESKFRRWHDALVHYNQALSLNQARPTLSARQEAAVYAKIGAADNRLGLAEAAARALQESLRRNPADAGARYQFALACALDGRTEESLQALRESFRTAADAAELRRYVLLSKTDVELEAVRDLPGYRAAVADARRVARR